MRLQLVQCCQLLPTVNLLLLGNTLLEALGPALCFEHVLFLKSLEELLGQYARRVLVPICTQAGVVHVPNFAAAKAFGLRHKLRHELLSALAGRLARAACTCSLSLPPTVDLVGGLIVHGVTPRVHRVVVRSLAPASSAVLRVEPSCLASLGLLMPLPPLGGAVETPDTLWFRSSFA